MILEEVDKVSTIRAKAVKMQVRPHLLFKVGLFTGYVVHEIGSGNIFYFV